MAFAQSAEVKKGTRAEGAFFIAKRFENRRRQQFSNYDATVRPNPCNPPFFLLDSALTGFAECGRNNDAIRWFHARTVHLA
jgi:hypothetical protein